ncbi:MAG: hypothetical protein WDN44_06365 [Sphingomonas sp.]
MVAMTFISTGRQVWQAVFLIRVDGLSPGVAGVALGLMYGIGQGLGTWLGGEFASRFGAVRRRHMLTTTVIGLLISIPMSVIAYWSQDWRLSTPLMIASRSRRG